MRNKSGIFGIMALLIVSLVSFGRASKREMPELSRPKPTESYPIPSPGKVREYSITENDTTNYVLKLAFDESDQPAYFFRNVFTPVCLSGECKPVYINFYWDLLGNYTHFDFPPGEVLTKMDHREFMPEDYAKLHDILSRQNSLLKDIAMGDLVGEGTENLADSVDAKAGATLKTIKNEVIDGAVFTCYTLWHLANGPVIDEIQRITETYKNDSLLHHFLTSTNHHYQYWAMERVIDKDGKFAESYGADLLKIIRGKNVFTARYALQKIGNPFFFDGRRQTWLWETYRTAAYPLQIVILKKLSKIPFRPPVAEMIAQDLVKTNPEQFALMLKLLSAQPKLPATVLQKLASHLENSNQDYTAEIYRVLSTSNPQSKVVRAKMSAYKSKLNQNVN